MTVRPIRSLPDLDPELVDHNLAANLIRLRDSGLTSRQIADDLNATGAPPINGIRWFPVTVRQALAVLPPPPQPPPKKSESEIIRDSWLDWLDGEHLGLFGTLTCKQAIAFSDGQNGVKSFAPITNGDIQATAAKFRNTFTRKIYGASAKHRPFLIFHHCCRDDAVEGSIHKRHHLHFLCELPDKSFAEVTERFIRSTKEPSLPWLYNEHEIIQITPGTARQTLGYSLADGRSRALTIGDAFLPTASRVPLARHENR